MKPTTFLLTLHGFIFFLSFITCISRLVALLNASNINSNTFSLFSFVYPKPNPRSAVMAVSPGFRVHGHMHDPLIGSGAAQNGHSLPSSPTSKPDMILSDNDDGDYEWSSPSLAGSSLDHHDSGEDFGSRNGSGPGIPVHRNFSRHLSPSGSSNSSQRLSGIGEQGVSSSHHFKESGEHARQQGDDDAFTHGPPTAAAAAGEEVPSAVLSNEAERILENAKKRLSVGFSARLLK